jgi:hypothetical protein
MKVVGKVFLGVLLFLLLWTVEAPAAWVNVPYYVPYPYVAPHVYTTAVTVGTPYYYSYSPYAYRAPVAVYVPTAAYVPSVPKPVVYAPSVPVYSYPQIGIPWTYWTY